MINAGKCTSCGDVLYSASRHDFQRCECGGCFIDGGTAYFRAGGLSLTRTLLKEDWDRLRAKYPALRLEEE